MSDIVIFLVGIGIFSITTAASLVYGYLTFNSRAEDQGVGIDPVDFAPADPAQTGGGQQIMLSDTSTAGGSAPLAGQPLLAVLR